MQLADPDLSQDLLDDTDVLCLYGIERKLYVKYLPWLEEKENRYLVVFDEGQASLDPPLHPHMRTVLLPHMLEEEVFKKLAWEFVFLRFTYLPSCSEEKKQRMQEIFSQMDYYQRGVHLLASDYSDFGARVLSNVLANLSLLPEAKKGEGLFGKFSKIPAIICGAGPSLTEEIPLLRSLKDHALIFAGGTALNILSEHSIVPHFAADVDPNPPYHRFLEQTLTEVPFFYQNRVAKEFLPIIQGPLLHVADSGGYPLEAWLQEQLGGKETSFDGGWNVGTFCTALCAAMGCDPIIFLGMDLALTGGRLYADGVEEKAKQEGLVKMLDKSGRPVLSKKDWVMAAEWLSEFAKNNPERSMINATRGGLRIAGLQEESFALAAEKLLTRPYDLKGKVLSAVEALPRAETKTAAPPLLSLVKESLKTSEKICSALLEIFEGGNPRPAKRGEAIGLEVDLEKEITYQKILDPLWNIWKHVFLRHLPDDPEAIRMNKWLFFRRVVKELQDAGC